MEGILEKPSRIPGKKTKVWSVLDETTLSFFQENKRSSCIGSVELTDIQSVKLITEYQFELVTDINSQIYTALSQEQCKEWVHKLSKYSKGQTEVKQSIPKPIPIVDSDKEGGEHTVEVKSAKNIFESTSTTEITTASSRPVSSILSTRQYGGVHTVEVRSARNIFESQSTKKEITTSNTPVYSSTFTEENKSAKTVGVKSPSPIAQASPNIKKFHANPVIDVSISKPEEEIEHIVEVKLVRNIFETLSTHKKPTTPPRPVSSIIPRISPESKRITSDTSRPRSTIEDVRSNLHHVNTSNRGYNHPGSETSYSEQKNLEGSEELKLEDARINLKHVSILKEDNKENSKTTQSKEETSEISSDKINDTIGISGDFNIAENSTQSSNDLKEIEEVGVLEIDNSKKVKMSEREKNGDTVCNNRSDRPDSGYSTTVGENGRNSKENESDETNRSLSANVSEIVNQKTNTADIISRIPDPDEQSVGKMELNQEQDEATLLVHKSNGSVNVSCSDVVTLNKQSDETSENVLENVNQETNTADIISRIPDPDEQSVGKMELNQEQDEATLLVHKSNGSVNVSCSDVVTLNKQSDETSENVLENVNQETNTADIISRIPDPDEQSVGKMELNQEQDEATLLVHKSNGSVNVSCSDVVTLNKQSDETSENVLENVNQETNTADIISRIPDPDEQSVGKMELNQEQDEATLLVHKSNGSVNVSCSDVVTLNKQSDETSENVLENVNQETNTADIISRIPDPDEQSVGKMELNQEQDEATLLVHKSNGSVNVSCSDVVTLNKQSDETSENVLENVNQETNTADIISRIPDPDEQSVGKMELNQEQDEATLLVHKSNGSVNVSCSDVVTLNKQSDETSENVLENVNQETNTADIISRIPDPDEESVGKMELNQEQDEATLLVHKSNGSVNVSCSDVVTLNKQSDETSENVLENVNQETNTADIISRIPDPDEQSVGKMELNQEQDEATLLVHKSNGSVNVSCSDVVTLNKQSDETSENVLENVNQETNTADIISRIPDPDEQSVGKMELNQEQDEATLLVHKSNGSVNVSCSDVVTLNKQSDETSENVLENVNQETNTADIISRIPDPDEQSVGKMELNQEQDEATLLVHKSNGSVNVSCSDVVTLNKQSDETSENVLENVNQETNTADIISQITEPDEQNGDKMKQEEEPNSSIVLMRKSKRKASVSLNDVFTLLPFADQADTPENYAPLTFPNTRRSQTPSSSCESENKDRTTLSSQNITDKPKLDENENKAASTELYQKEAQNVSTSHHDNVDGVVGSVSPMHEVVENYLDIDSLFSKINFPNIPALPNTIPRRADLISFHELKDTLDKLGSEDECSEVPSEDDECSEVNSTSSDQIIQRLSRLAES